MAIPLGSGSEIKGLEDFGDKPPRLHDIIYPSGSAINIAKGVEDIYDDMGII